jgi:hypothetical protein
MSRIFVGQTKLTIQLETGTDITDASSAKIRFRKPNGTLGEFNASISDPEKGTIIYEIQNSEEIDQAGFWNFWAFITYSDAKTIAGTVSNIQIFTEGSL